MYERYLDPVKCQACDDGWRTAITNCVCCGHGPREQTEALPITKAERSQFVRELMTQLGV